MGVNASRHSYISWWRDQKKRTPKEQTQMSAAMMTSKEEFDDYEWFGEAKAPKASPFGTNQVIPNTPPDKPLPPTPKKGGKKKKKK